MHPSHKAFRWALATPSVLLFIFNLVNVHQSWLLLALMLLTMGALDYLLQGWLLAHLSLGRVARFSMGLALGLVTLIVIAFPLALFPHGFGSLGWATALLLLTLATLRGSGSETLPHPVSWPNPTSLWLYAVLPTLMLTLASVAVVIALRLVSVGALSAPSSGFTLLWLLPQDEQALRFQVGVRNAEQMPVTYRLQVQADGKRLYEWPALRFEPLEARVYDVPLETHGATLSHIEVLLYRDDAPDEVYRRVDYWRAVPTQAP